MPVETMGFRQDGAQKNKLALIVMPVKDPCKRILSWQIPPGSRKVDKPSGIGEFDASDTAGMVAVLNDKLKQDAGYFPHTVIIFVKGLSDEVRQGIQAGRDVGAE